MKNILVILPWIPYPLGSGGNQAIFNGIQCIKENYNVSVLCVDYMPWRKNSFFTALKKEFKGVKLYISWDYKIILNELVRKIIGKKIDYKYLNLLSFRNYSKNIFDKINKIIKNDNIDCVQIEMFDALSIVEKIPIDIKKIFIHHEIRFVLCSQIVDLVKNKKKFLAKLNKEKTKELTLLNKFDLVITLSDTDTSVLKRNGLKSRCYSSFAVVCGNCQKYSYSNLYEKKLTFVGPEQHLPNKEGLLWFLENCWNEIKKQDETYSLNVIGFWTEKTKMCIRNTYRDVSFCGFVDDLYEYLKGSLMIVPIFAGSGIRMKILESAQMRVPFVSTSVGCSGLSFESERDCLIADEPNSFIKSIFKMENEDYRKKFVESAYETFQKNYSLTALKENRLEIMSKI